MLTRVAPYARVDVRGLFFAVRPQAAAAGLATAVLSQQWAKHHLTGHAMASELLHVTLHSLGAHPDEVPPSLLAQALAAGALVEAEPFDVRFDRVGSLGDETKGGLALTGGAFLRPLRAFQRVVGSAMTASGIGHLVRKHFNPHVSLVFDATHVNPETIAPIDWTVNELVLIESLVGQATHVVRGCWPLVMRQARFAGW